MGPGKFFNIPKSGYVVGGVRLVLFVPKNWYGQGTGAANDNVNMGELVSGTYHPHTVYRHIPTVDGT